MAFRKCLRGFFAKPKLAMQTSGGAAYGRMMPARWLKRNTTVIFIKRTFPILKSAWIVFLEDSARLIINPIIRGREICFVFSAAF